MERVLWRKYIFQDQLGPIYRAQDKNFNGGPHDRSLKL